MGPVLAKVGMRAVCLAFLSLFCFTDGGFSQQKPLRDTRAIQDVDGFTIRIVRIAGGSYGYEIRRGSDVLVRQKRNPFTGSELGLKEPNDAMRTATWFVETVLKKEQNLPRSKRLPERILSARPIPRAVARELGIAID